MPSEIEHARRVMKEEEALAEVEKPRAFFFHYHKPASLQAHKPQISVHWRGSCLIVDNVECAVPTKGKINKRQPYWVMRGYGVVRIQEGVAKITAT